MKTLILRLVHYLIALGEFLHYLVLLVPSQALSMTMKQPALSSIQADSKTIKKRPSHLGFLVAEDQFSFKDLANMIVWSVSMGISYISVYDINGEIKRNSSLLKQFVEKSQDEVFGQDKPKYDIQLFSSSDPLEQQPLAPPRAHSYRVHLLCMEDGQRHIIGTVKHLSKLVSTGSYNVKDIQTSSVDNIFHEYMQFPDPEVCLKFGPVDSLLGYLPWQIRLTEIISVSSHRGITYKSFLSSLVQFGCTIQRFGK